MLPETYVDIAPHLSRRQNVLWASSDPRINAYFRRYESELPRHSFKIIVPVIRDTVTVKLRDRDHRERRTVRWEDLVHHVRHGYVKKTKFRHVVGMQHHVDHAFDVICHYFRLMRNHLRDSVVRTNILPIHWEWVRIFFRSFSEARAIHVNGQLEAFLSYTGFEHALQPYLQQKLHTVEFFWMSDANAAPRFVDWFLAPSGEDREVRFVQGSAGTAEVVRVLYERVLLQDMPVFNRCVLVVYVDPGMWSSISGDQLIFLHELQGSVNPKPNPRTWVRFSYTHHGGYVAVVVESESHASL